MRALLRNRHVLLEDEVVLLYHVDVPTLRRIRTVCLHEKLLFGGKSVFDVLFKVAGSG